MIGSVLGGTDRIDEPTETGDGGVDLENPGGHRLRRLIPRRRRGFGAILEILKAHFLGFVSDLNFESVGEASSGGPAKPACVINW